MAGKKILIAVDNSKNSSYAFEYYRDMIHKDGFETIIFHCLDRPYLPDYGYIADSGISPSAMIRVYEDIKETAKEIRKAYDQRLNDNRMTGRVVWEYGHPGETICAVASKEEVSCIVLGTRGQGAIRRTILGSVSDYVIHHAHCPVLVCRQ